MTEEDTSRVESHEVVNRVLQFDSEYLCSPMRESLVVTCNDNSIVL